MGPLAAAPPSEAVPGCTALQPATPAGTGRDPTSERAALERLAAEVAECRSKAERYEEIKPQIPVWRATARRYDRLVSELARRKRRAGLTLLLLGRAPVWRALVGEALDPSPPSANDEPRPATDALPVARVGAAAESGHICILSRKDLRDITRVPRMAKALIDAGNRVTVVALRAPVQQLQDMCPAVEYISVAPRPVTAKLRARASRPRGRPRGKSDGGRRGTLVRARRLAISPACRLGRMLRRVLLVAPFTLVLKKSGETFAAAWRDAADDSTLTLLSRLGGQLHQWAMTHAFAKEADIATRGRHFDVVQAHDNYAVVAAARLAARDRAKLVYDAVELSSHRLAVELSRFEALRERCERREEAAIFRKADLMLAVGEGVADWYARTYAVARPLVVRNCRYYWDYQIDGRLRADAGLGKAARVVVWSGSAYPQQGLELLLDAVPFMAPQIHVAIVATALPRWLAYVTDELPRHAAALGVADRVHFLPAQEPNDLVPYISGADIGVIPRPSEHLNNFLSMPNKFLEMVMARLPIAVSRVGDMAAAVEQYRIGAVFDEHKPEEMAAAIEGMLAPEVYPELKANAMKAAQSMTWETESAGYVAAIGALISASAVPAPVSAAAGARAARSLP